MKQKIVFGSVFIGVVAVLFLGFLSITPEGRGQPQPPPASSLEDKLNQILNRLDKIEKRLSQLEASRTEVRPGMRPRETAVVPRAAPINAAALLPFVPNKTKPRSTTFKGCGAHGDDRGDQDLNFLKNRIDEPDNWIEVDFDAVLGQSYPPTVGRRQRTDWDDEELAEVQRYEGLPLSIVCYFAWAKDEAPESCNCHIEDKSMYDVHTWLTKEPAQIEGSRAPDRRAAIVAEVTPRLKADHPQWTQSTIRRLAKEQKKVRVSGWLLLDQEHPEQLKPAGRRSATRGTLWEIHPIIEIEVWQNGQWVPLDELHSALKSLWRTAA
jgi:hypothetical protein